MTTAIVPVLLQQRTMKLENVPLLLHLVRSLYEEHVCINPSEAIEIEACTRNQTLSDLWHNERKLRISVSVMKTVCHRRRDTNIKPLVTSKLSPQLSSLYLWCTAKMSMTSFSKKES